MGFYVILTNNYNTIFYVVVTMYFSLTSSKNEGAGFHHENRPFPVIVWMLLFQFRLATVLLVGTVVEFVFQRAVLHVLVGEPVETESLL